MSKEKILKKYPSIDGPMNDVFIEWGDCIAAMEEYASLKPTPSPGIQEAARDYAAGRALPKSIQSAFLAGSEFISGEMAEWASSEGWQYVRKTKTWVSDQQIATTPDLIQMFKNR